MSRSRRKTPIIGWAGSKNNSEKNDKQSWHRRFRHKARQLFKSFFPEEAEDMLPKNPNEVINPWSMSKDGKTWIDEDSKYMRK